MKSRRKIITDENGKPIPCKVFVPSYGTELLFGIEAVTDWLNESNVLGRKISATTVRAIATGKARLLNYSEDLITAVEREFPQLVKA